MIRVLLFCVAAWGLPLGEVLAACTAWPEGTAFVGLSQGRWRAYVVPASASSPVLVPLEAEPRTPVFDSESDTLFYVDESTSVNAYAVRQKANKVIMASSGSATYGQPFYDRRHERLYLVEFKGGNSVDTDIVRLNPGQAIPQPAVSQRSSQFEPYVVGDWLYYSHVHCVLGCGHVIQEIWRLNTVGGQAE